MADQNTNPPHGHTEPCIYLFGSLSLAFDAAAFAQLRKVVVEDDNNVWLLDVVSQLSQDLELILSALPSLQTTGPRARQELADLREAFTGGRPLDLPFPLPNTVLIPLVVIDQLSQYAAFARQKSVDRDDEPDNWPADDSDTEIMGLCTGTLSSFVVSSAQSWDDFRKYGAAAIRLGLLVGLVIDSQDAASGSGRSRSLSVAWSREQGDKELQRVLQDFNETYVSVYYDKCRSTITTSAASLPRLVPKLRTAGLGVTEIGLYGAFHSAARNSVVFEKLVSFCNSHSKFQLPVVTASRSYTVNGSRLVEGALHEHALRCILVEPARWFDDFSAALWEGCDRVKVFSFGSERSVPLSLSSRSRMQVVHPADARDDANRGPERLYRESDIAVVGMACKVAGADDVQEFWDLLVEGESQHRDISTSERFSFEDTPFRTCGDSNMQRKWYASLVNGHDQFDHRFFKKSARESATMDPQQRQILQVAYQAAEQGGYFAKEASERDRNLGVFVGVCLSDYESNIGCHAANAFTATGNLQGFVAGKVSHFLGWTGPALTVDTACSSSLVAVHQACASILSGECNAALAGGTHIMTSAGWFQNLAAGSFLSPTGQCKPFDAAADGYCRGEGVGAVLLKKLSQAIADGDQVLGVIGATAVQQNENCTPIFVPNVPSLSNLFTTVTARAHVKPSSITVVEAHGTGTAVGDPAEWDSIRQTLGGHNRPSEQPLMVSSTKGLVGHLECTSGIISLIKMLLMLNKRMLPPQASFHTLNPALNAVPSDHMFIPRRPQPWDVEFRVGLINNYGASGSNASMVVMQAPTFGAAPKAVVVGEGVELSPGVEVDDKGRRQYPFWLSGLDAGSLRRSAKALRRFLARSTSIPSIGNISYNLAHQSDRALDQRFIFAAASVSELDRQLATCEDGQGITCAPAAADQTVVLCFGGQISTSIGLDPNVYNNAGLFRKHLDNVDNVVRSLGYSSIFPAVFQRTPVSNTVHLQTTLFAMQYACAQAWIDSGIRPTVLVGHSFGELTALCVSQVLSLEDTVKMIARRATIVRDAWGADKGAMMAIEGDLDDVEKLLLGANSQHTSAPASVACYNGPRSFTLAGSTEAMDAVDARILDVPGRTMKSRRLNVTNAFHSALVDPLVHRLEESCKDLTFRKPVIPLERAVESPSIKSELSARSVADHMRNPVYFHHALERIARRYSSSTCVFLEAGTNSTITAMASRALNNSTVKAASTFHGLNMANSDNGWNALADTTLSLWKAGLNVQHWAHNARQRRYQTDIEPLLLPPYQFDPNARHWLELKSLPKALPASAAAPPQSEANKEPEGLLSFFAYLDGSIKKRAQFRINTATEEYKTLLLGHQTIQTAPICPATIQISFVIEAIGQLRPELRSKHEPQIQDVQYRSPVCANSSRATWIEVNNDVQGELGWHFDVFSTEGHSQTRTVHTVGTVIFSDASNAPLKRQLANFERLFSHRRAVDLLQSAEIDEVLANRNIYRIFSEIVDYGEEYRGLQKMVTRGNESAGLVVRKSSKLQPAPWFDAHLADTFCQLGGLWINCMTDRPPSDVYLANGIDQWIRLPRSAGADGSSAEPSKEFHVFATNHRPSDKLSMTDVFVFDAEDGALVEVILGIAYVKIPKLSMQKMLSRLTDPEWLASAPARSTVLDPVTAPKPISRPEANSPPHAPLQAPLPMPREVELVTEIKVSEPAENSLHDDVAGRVKVVIAELSGVEVAEIGDDCDLADLGIDSLAGMEMVHDIESALHITLPEKDIIMVVTMRDLMKVVTGALGMEVDADDDSSSDNDVPSLASSSEGVGVTTNLTTPAPQSDQDKDEHEAFESDDLRLPHAVVMEAFNETKELTDKVVVDVGQAHYVSDALPLQNELSVLLTLDAFEALGAGFRHAQPGERLQRIVYGKEHVHFVNYLYDMIEAETQIIKLDGDIITRTAIPFPQRTSTEVYEELRRRFPDQYSADALTYYAGMHLQQVLSGETTGVKLIFGCSEGRELVSSFYAEWPLNQLMYTQMEDFFTRLAGKLRARQDGKPLRILEMGAGTGGTTKRIVPLLAQLQIPIEYTFTDLAPSFVAAARKKWGKMYPWMRFRNHDIEKAPEEDLVNTQHFVLASNAIHATHSICESTRNVRKFLRPDGFLLMGEMTRTPYWVDTIFGLFEGWWLFDDGRKHALTHESRWERDLQAVGYGRVDWTEGARPECEIEKLILAAASSTNLEQYRSTRSTQNSTAVNYRFRKENSADCAKREEVVAKYVRDLTQGFGETLEPLSSPPTNSSLDKTNAKWVVITGATGGLGAHMVAEAAVRPDVSRVICLNRRNKQNALDRQIHALRKKGINLTSTELSKLTVHETDLSQPTHLGLPPDIYTALLPHVTHIIHNAWLMHSKWPVARFSPQLRIMSHLLHFARDVSLHCTTRSPLSFIFISSIATVGYHPYLISSPSVPEARVPIASVLPTGYGDAKYICERMLDATLHAHPTRFRAAAIRLGQIAGSSLNGHWNPMEHVSFLVKSSQTLGCLPDLQGSMGWTSADDVARGVVDIAMQPDRVALYPIYHIDNPVRQPWSRVIEVLADALGNGTRVVPFEEWLGRVRNWPRKEDNGPEGRNPAFLLVNFLEEHFARMSCGGLVMGTRRAREHSETLARVGMVDEGLIRLFVEGWREMGFLE
nr:polyketide synthase [Phaeosphaeriaceae sp. CF-150626]